MRVTLVQIGEDQAIWVVALGLDPKAHSFVFTNADNILVWIEHNNK